MGADFDKYTHNSCKPDDSSVTGESLLAATGSWLDENVRKPAYNAGVVQPVNVFANAVNLVSREPLIGKLTPAEMAATDSSGTEVTRSISGALAGLWPYLLGGKLVSGALRTGGSALALEGVWARVAASETAGMVLAAGTFDALRDVNPGETRLGNVAGGVTAFGVFGAGNHLTRNWSLAERAFLANPVIGALGGEAQLRTSHFVSGTKVGDNERLHAWSTGAAVNFVLPWAQESIGKAVDHAAVKFGRALHADRFVRYHDLHGRSAVLDSEVWANPLARVQTESAGNGSRADLTRARVILDPLIGGGSKVGLPADSLLTAQASDLGHELSHLRVAKAAEPAFKQASELLKSGDVGGAESLFKRTRQTQELQSRTIGDQITAELSKRSARGDSTNQHGADPLRPLDSSYAERFHQEWLQFKSTDGQFRPVIEFNRETALIVIDSGFTLDSMIAAGRIIGVADLTTGAYLEGSPTLSRAKLKDFAGDPLNHGSIVLAGNDQYTGLAQLAPDSPFILIRAFGPENSLLRTQWNEGSISRDGWTEGYKWAFDLSRRRGLPSVANCSFGGFAHAMDGTGWESYKVSHFTGPGKPDHIMVAATGPGDGTPIHATWQQGAGESKVITAEQTGATRYSLWGLKSSGPGAEGAGNWRMHVVRDGQVVNYFDGSQIGPNLWNGRQQLVVPLSGNGVVQFIVSRTGPIGEGTTPAGGRFDFWVQSGPAKFLDHQSPTVVSEPAVFPDVLGVGLERGTYAPDQALPGSKPDVLLPGQGPISFRTPTVSAMVAALLRGQSLDLAGVRQSLGKYPFGTGSAAMLPRTPAELRISDGR